MDQAMADGDDVNKHAPITTKGRREKVKDKDEKAKMDEDESKSHVKKRRKDSKASFATTSFVMMFCVRSQPSPTN
jgi:hypothetical protein